MSIRQFYWLMPFRAGFRVPATGAAGAGPADHPDPRLRLQPRPLAARRALVRGAWLPGQRDQPEAPALPDRRLRPGRRRRSRQGPGSHRRGAGGAGRATAWAASSRAPTCGHARLAARIPRSRRWSRSARPTAAPTSPASASAQNARQMRYHAPWVQQLGPQRLARRRHASATDLQPAGQHRQPAVRAAPAACGREGPSCVRRQGHMSLAASHANPCDRRPDPAPRRAAARPGGAAPCAAGAGKSMTAISVKALWLGPRLGKRDRTDRTPDGLEQRTGRINRTTRE